MSKKPSTPNLSLTAALRNLNTIRLSWTISVVPGALVSFLSESNSGFPIGRRELVTVSLFAISECLSELCGRAEHSGDLGVRRMVNFITALPETGSGTDRQTDRQTNLSFEHK